MQHKLLEGHSPYKICSNFIGFKKPKITSLTRSSTFIARWHADAKDYKSLAF